MIRRTDPVISWFKVLRKQEGMWFYGQRFLMGQVSDNFQDLQVFHLE